MTRDAPAASIRESEPGTLLVTGVLGLGSVVGLRRAAGDLLEARLAAGAPVVMDLGEVTRTDSAGLALLLHWMRFARGHRGQIAFRRLPAQLLAIASTCGVVGILPTEREAEPE